MEYQLQKSTFLKQVKLIIHFLNQNLPKNPSTCNSLNTEKAYAYFQNSGSERAHLTKL